MARPTAPTARAASSGRVAIYAVLIVWTIICLFPIYWTITTSFKTAANVMRGNMIPWVDFHPELARLALARAVARDHRSGLDRARRVPQALRQFGDHGADLFGAGGGAGKLRGLRASAGSSYRFGFMRNPDISFFFLSQLILPPVVLALPFLVLYKELALLDTRIGLILLYTLTVLPIVIWIMRDQFGSIPTELEEAALVDGLSIWGAFLTIVLPIALPGMVAAFILSLVLTWNEYFFAALLTSTDAKTLPVMVASQTGSQGINWWSMAALSFGAIVPLIVIGVALERYIIKGMAAGAVK